MVVETPSNPRRHTKDKNTKHAKYLEHKAKVAQGRQMQCVILLQCCNDIVLQNCTILGGRIANPPWPGACLEWDSSPFGTSLHKGIPCA